MSNIKYEARSVSEINYQGPYTVVSSVPKNFSVTVRNVPNTGYTATQELVPLNSVQKAERAKR